MTRAVDFVEEVKLLLDEVQWTSGSATAHLNNRHALSELARYLRSQRDDVLLIGNGGLLAVAQHLAVDLWTQAGVRAQAIADPVEITAAANDHGFDASLARPVERLARGASLLVAMSASGRSPNVLAAVEVARKHKLFVVTLSAGVADNPLRALGDLNCYIPTTSTGAAQVVMHALLHAACEELYTGEQVR